MRPRAKFGIGDSILIFPGEFSRVPSVIVNHRFSKRLEEKMASRKVTFLSVSDLHFNPCAGPWVVSDLIKHSYEEWVDIFSFYGNYGFDTPYPLLASFLNDA